MYTYSSTYFQLMALGSPSVRRLARCVIVTELLRLRETISWDETQLVSNVPEVT